MLTLRAGCIPVLMAVRMLHCQFRRLVTWFSWPTFRTTKIRASGADWFSAMSLYPPEDICFVLLVQYSHAPHNDVLVNDGPHIGQ